MPCHDAEETLDETLNSLFEQMLRDFEIIAVDDGSTDNTLGLLKRWARQDPRLKVIHREHGGIIQALNAGLSHCRAPIVARMDADDWAYPARLSKQVSYLQDHPEIAAVGCLVEGFPEKDVRGGFQRYIEWLNRLVEPEDIAREIYIESPLVHPSVTARRVWLVQVGGYQERGWPEDYDLWLRMHLQGARFAKVPETLLKWREHPGRLTRVDSRYSVKNFLRAKAFYLCQGPLANRDAVIIWGAGQMGRRVSKHLQREGAALAAFVDIDPKKIGRRKRGCPIVPPDSLQEVWDRYQRPVILAAVGARNARRLIRERLTEMGFQEARDWWAVV
jgi:glycosyltransferase involved in cell wall biosynthesis